MSEEARVIPCLRCGGEMKFRQRKDFTTNAGSLLFCDEGPILDLFVCPSCGKAEFFVPVTPIPAPAPEADKLNAEWDEFGLVICPQCKKHHDAYDSSCPLCGLPREALLLPQQPKQPPEEPERAEPETQKKRLHFVRRRDHKDPWE